MLRKSYTTHNFQLQVVDSIDFSNWLFMEWVLQLDLRHAQTFKAAKTLLSQTCLQQALHAQGLRHRLRRLLCTQQIAADNTRWHMVAGSPSLERLLHTRLQAFGLGQTDGIEWHIHLALETQLFVPVGLAVTNEQKVGHTQARDITLQLPFWPSTAHRPPETPNRGHRPLHRVAKFHAQRCSR